ncbi:photosynthetic NDH subunit of subcomplex B 5, chloroplastic [Mercurialis annua]|uniref:photosynthetic NDH subunit of subcomplex B 5, chloroplastic n=1 Tax=Mercurialis annua TaxID=3986 RepID=UPI00215E3605|nr:photosynthetic NDH subunit of subcomplex B 5, chloroplastic [Mercurialis annua]
MATSSSSSLTVLLSNPIPKISSHKFKLNNQLLNQKTLIFNNCTQRSVRVKAAGLSQIEPDLNEDPTDRWATPSIDPEDFKYGEYDGHHTYSEGQEKRTAWELVVADYEAVEPPTGFQGLISWLFLPAVAAAMYFDAPGEYLFIGAGLFVIIFCIIEMDKPDKPHNFEPQIYNMERTARDKLINEYNSMNKWEFNEKYGDLWDFTIPKTRDDIMKR